MYQVLVNTKNSWMIRLHTMTVLKVTPVVFHLALRLRDVCEPRLCLLVSVVGLTPEVKRGIAESSESGIPFLVVTFLKRSHNGGIIHAKASMGAR